MDRQIQQLKDWYVVTATPRWSVFPRGRCLLIAPCSRARSQPISEQQVKELCLKAREILVEEANVQWIDSPVTVSPADAADGSGPAEAAPLRPDMR